MAGDLRMATNTPRRVLEDAAATPEAIAAAIEALTPADLARLRRFADHRIWMLGPKAQCDTGAELLNIAVLAALERTRRWNKSEVGFPTFMFGAMRSITSNWAKSYKPEGAPILEADLRRENEEGNVLNPLDVLREQRSGPEQRISNQETLEQIEALFKEDEQAQKVLMAWQDGLKGPAVRDLWKYSQKEFNAIVRRIRRHIEAAGLMPRSGKR